MSIKIILAFFAIFSHFEIGTLGNDSSSEERKINVVLFFSNGDAPAKSPSGLKLLNMEEKARVKLSTNAHPVHPYVVQRSAQNCKEMLRNAIQSLVHFCQNALGMKSAVASVSVHEITKDISAQEAEVPHEIRVRQTLERTQRQFWKTDQNTRGLRNIQKAHLKNIVTSPAHKEVFKIRVKRNTETGNYEKRRCPIRDVNLGQSKDRPAWDIFDVMQHVRYSFFGKLFEDEIRKNEFKAPPQKALESMKLSKVDAGLFETVRSTLSSLQETPDPFLMVIFGGHLSEIGDSHSALVQSVKHVTESTDPENTLIVLTTSCPESNEADHPDVVEIDENPKPKRRHCEDFPVFAKGPKSEKLSAVSALSDIPATIKDALQEISPNFGGK
ncbi:unnamed protein product [Callosobruchus maculatus]|uniref:Uncharacterized protein n=1 Tax=Callosobruchus maculatus TaxID=64391 RepID=A0A653C3P5_CALMS|nr:unnamed protein product [Callosobruchus maculatus]